VQSFLFTRRPIWFVHWCKRRFGTTFTLKILRFGNVVYLGDPAGVKEMYTGDASVFHAGEGNSVLEPVTGPRSILQLDEEEHLRERRLMLPLFKGDNIERYGGMTREVTEREVAGWPTHRPFALRPYIREITLEVMIRALFGIHDAERLAQIHRLLPHVFDVNLATMFIPALRVDLGSHTPWGKFVRARRELDEMLYTEIRRRRADPGDDVLSALIGASESQGRGLTDAELRDELVSLLLAGHETTTASLLWAFERLVRHPDAMRRLEHAVADGDDAFVDAAIREAQRVRPVLTGFSRRLAEPARLRGHLLPAGTRAVAGITMIQLSEDIYPDARRYRPERFLEGEPPSYSWIPYGGGPRRCLGARMAQHQMRVIVSSVFDHVALRPASRRSEVGRVRGVTMIPSRGARVICDRRMKPLRG
jgi:cytochrome P450